MAAKFGPAGNAASFTAMGYKTSLQVPEYLTKMGLDAFEYQCGRGVNIGQEKATELGRLAREKNITLSLHAPYYISMSSVEEEKRQNSVQYILASAKAVSAMGGSRIVVHTGSCGKISREQALPGFPGWQRAMLRRRNLRDFLWAPRLGCHGIFRIDPLRHVLVLSGAGVGGRTVRRKGWGGGR